MTGAKGRAELFMPPKVVVPFLPIFQDKAMKLDSLKALLKADKPKEASPSRGLSSGHTLLNLGTTGDPRWCFLPGHNYLFVGDSNSGKTYICFAAFAEACLNPKFDKYQLIYDGGEEGALFDWEKHFGKAVAKRVKAPAYSKKGRPLYSRSPEEMYYNLDDAVRRGPCIYILDSWDSLVPEADLAKFYKKKKANREGGEEAGSFGTSKASINSSHMRIANNILKKNGSIFIGISQSRDRVGFGAQYDPKTRSGGHSLTFYAALELWSSIRQRVKARVRGKDRQVGIISKIRVKRSRITGKDRTIEVPIYWSSGIDDVGGMVRWLIEEKYWKGEQDEEWLVSKYDASPERTEELRQLVKEHWDSIEAACEVKRRKRYV